MKEVFDFLNIDESYWNKGERFFPERSIKNINLWRNSPYQEEINSLEKYI